MDEPDKEKGYYGGLTAAPIFHTIAEQVAKYLKVRPDREESSGEFAGAQNRELRTAAVRP
jgi:hypothetical protein